MEKGLFDGPLQITLWGCLAPLWAFITKLTRKILEVCHEGYV